MARLKLHGELVHQCLDLWRRSVTERVVVEQHVGVEVGVQARPVRTGLVMGIHIEHDTKLMDTAVDPSLHVDGAQLLYDALAHSTIVCRARKVDGYRTYKFESGVRVFVLG